MGVRSIFSRGGQNFPGGGQNILFALKNTQKDTIFLEKSRKTYYFGGPGGARAPSCPPLRTPMIKRDQLISSELPFKFSMATRGFVE